MASAKNESFGFLTLNNLVNPPSPRLEGDDEPGIADGVDRGYLSSPLLI
jgi:hypothetical protein